MKRLFTPLVKLGCPAFRFWRPGKHNTRIPSLKLLFLVPFAVLALAQNPQSSAPPDQSTEHRGQVIFSRSADENGQTPTTTRPAATKSAGQIVSAPVATDDERQAVTFTAFDMDVHLRLDEHEIAVRALLHVRNDGRSPLVHVPLQISSSLTWERIRVAGHDTAFTVATLNSDVDHTGQLHEAAIALSQPLAPGATLDLDVTYSGAIELNARRLLAIGTPDETAYHSDWDMIGADFTGLRGFGNVLWYPASSVPAVLGMSQAATTIPWQPASGANVDSARIFDEMGEHKLRMSGASFRLHLAAEFPHGHAPTVAVIDGHIAQLTITDAPTEGDEVSGVATASIDTSNVGFEAPSLFLAVRIQKHAENTEIFALPTDEPAVEDWSASAAAVSPFLQGWLGPKPRSELAILDLPDPDDAPFETGSLLATNVRQATPEQLDRVLAHALTHAWMQSPIAWLSEGVADFMSTLWIERENGRQKALEVLESGRAALAMAEPASPGVGPGQPLGQAIAPIYYREKAAYVFWMLRDLAGDKALSNALRVYASTPATGFDEKSGWTVFQKLIAQASAQSNPDPQDAPVAPEDSSSSASSTASHDGERRDLSWFFADWVDADKGLPDISIDSVFVAAAQTGNWLATVNLSNSGYAAAEIPVTLRSSETSVAERVIVPARGKTVQRILIHGRPTEVQANDGTVPETEASIHVKTLSDVDAAPSSSPSTP